MVTLCTAAAPFAAGAWLPLPPAAAAPSPRSACGPQLAALALLYAECCERLCDAEAILYLSDVLVAFALEVCCVLVSAAWCALYARAGVLSREEARVVALCALPRSLDTRECCAVATSHSARSGELHDTLVDVVRGAWHVPAAGRVRGAHAGAVAGGAGAGAPRGHGRGHRCAARRRLVKREQFHHRTVHEHVDTVRLSFLPNETFRPIRTRLCN